MKGITYILGIMSALLTGSLDTPALGATGPEDVVNRFITEFVDAHNPDALDSILAEDYVLHTAGQTLNKNEFKAFASGNFAALPDLTARFKIVESTDSKVILFETVNGTHTGSAEFLGFPTTNRAVSFTVLHVMEIRGNRISTHWAQADFGATLAQLSGTAPAVSHDSMWSEIDAAEQAISRECDGAVTRPETVEVFKNVMQSLDSSDATLNRVLTPNFRLSASGGLNQDRNGVRATFQMAGSIGSGHSNRELRIKYSGSRYSAIYGPVNFVYNNPDGLFGFPATGPIAVGMTELQIIGHCGEKVFRQYSHADITGLFRQISQPVSDRTRLAKEFLDAFVARDFVKARSLMTDDFVHISPMGTYNGADNFLDNYNAPEGWNYSLVSISEDPAGIYVKYLSLVPGRDPVGMVEYLVQSGDKFSKAEVYFLSAP